VEEVSEYLKKKSSTWIAQNVERKACNFLGHKLWARVYSAEEARALWSALGDRLDRLFRLAVP
jgi:hypothetical protein